MRFLQVGHTSVVGALRRIGHEVVEAFVDHPDLAIPGRPFDIRELWQRLDPKPDVLLVVDTLGRQTLPFGIEDVPVVRLYYAIDVHLNYFWQRHYGRLFDLVLSAQRDYVPLFEADGVPARWLPASVDPKVYRDLQLPRVHDVAFVGTVDGSRPKRTAALDLLRRHCDLVTYGATLADRLSAEEAARVFSSAKIVFNESVLGDVNFRVFEAMACGAMLLTEHVGNGLTDLFTPGEHLVVYTPDDLLEKVAHYLSADDERARVAAAGAAAIRASHTTDARMAELTEAIAAGIPRRDVAPRASLHWGLTAELTVLRGLTDPGVGMRSAAESLNTALAHGDADAAIGLGELMIWNGRDDGARMVLAEARRLDPKSVRAWFLAAEIERHGGDLQMAAALFREGVRAADDASEPTRRRALSALEDIGSSECCSALGTVLAETGLPATCGLVRHVDGDPPRTAFDYYVEALKLDRANREAARSAAAMLELIGLAEFAIAFHTMIVQAAPGDIAARRGLCAALRRSFLVAAAEHQERVIDGLRGLPIDGAGRDRAEAYHDAGMALLAQRSLAAAIDALEQAIALAPGRADFTTDCALARVEAGDYAGARARLARIRGHAGAEDEALARLIDVLDEANAAEP